MEVPPAKKDGKQLHRTAQQSTLAAFLPWGSSTGAGRVALAGRKSRKKLKCRLANGKNEAKKINVENPLAPKKNLLHITASVIFVPSAKGRLYGKPSI